MLSLSPGQPLIQTNWHHTRWRLLQSPCFFSLLSPYGVLESVTHAYLSLTLCKKGKGEKIK